MSNMTNGICRCNNGYIPYADVTLIVLTETIESSYYYSPKLNKLSPIRVDMTIQGVQISQLLELY